MRCICDECGKLCPRCGVCCQADCHPLCQELAEIQDDPGYNKPKYTDRQVRALLAPLRRRSWDVIKGGRP